MSDIFPTGYFGADIAEITDGDTVAVFGWGPVGQFTILSARLLSAGRILAVDSVPPDLKSRGPRGRGSSTSTPSTRSRPFGDSRAALGSTVPSMQWGWMPSGRRVVLPLERRGTGQSGLRRRSRKLAQRPVLRRSNGAVVMPLAGVDLGNRGASKGGDAVDQRRLPSNSPFLPDRQSNQ
jgi:hypothetical protein